MFGVIPFGLMFLNFVGMVLFFVAIVVAVKFIVRGARGLYGRGHYARGQYGRDHGGLGYGGHGGRGWGGQWHRHWGPDAGSHEGGPWRGHGGHGGHVRRDEALDLVRERLARGEIDTAEYQRLRAGLSSVGEAATGPDDAVASRGGHHGVHGGRRRRDRALGIARLRFASGEITLDDFQAIRAALEA